MADRLAMRPEAHQAEARAFLTLLIMTFAQVVTISIGWLGNLGKNMVFGSAMAWKYGFDVICFLTCAVLGAAMLSFPFWTAFVLLGTHSTAGNVIGPFLGLPFSLVGGALGIGVFVVAAETRSDKKRLGTWPNDTKVRH